MTPLCTHLRDGTPVRFRPVLPEDRERIQNGLLLMSAESRYRRFFCPTDRLSETQLQYFTEVDQTNHVAWIALDPSVPGLPGLGIARFIRAHDRPAVADFAITTIDAFQARGLGTALLAILQLMARARGIEILRAIVLEENEIVTAWLRRLGALGKSPRDGVCEMDLPVHRDCSLLPPTETASHFAQLLTRFDAELRNSAHVAES